MIGNVGFYQEGSSVKMNSRKFHSFPESLEFCEALLELENDGWMKLEQISIDIHPLVCI